jgi:hypothetical protein
VSVRGVNTSRPASTLLVAFARVDVGDRRERHGLASWSVRLPGEELFDWAADQL